MFGRGIGLDINGDGIPDLRVGPFGGVRPDIGMAFMGAPPMYPPPYGYGYGYGGARIDIDGDGIPDVRVGPFGDQILEHLFMDLLCHLIIQHHIINEFYE